MTHIDEGSLQAYLDGELLLEERWRTERHLEECELCRRELEAQEARATGFARAMGWLNGAVDLPQAPERPALPSRPGEPEAGRRGKGGAEVRRLIPRAAVLLLFAGAAASATVPGWPLRVWIEEITSPAAEPPPAPAPAATPQAPADAPAAAGSGVFVEAVDGAVDVVLRDARDLRVRAVLVDGTTAGVTTEGEATNSRFRTGAGRVEVLGPAGGEVRIEIPRGATMATVMINGEVALRKAASNLDLNTELPGLDSAGIAFSVEQ